MEQSNEALVRRGYEAFGSGDMETLMSLMAQDAVHVIPGASPFAGEHKGHAELTDLYGQIFALSGGTYRADLVSVDDLGGGRVRSVHRGTAQREGRTLDTEETLTFTIEEGKVARIESSFSPEDQAAEDAFWS